LEKGFEKELAAKRDVSELQAAVKLARSATAATRERKREGTV
jgi:hypothetical protein